MANYGKVHATGMDITLATATSISKDIKLIMSGSYTWQQAIDLTDPDSKSYKDQLPYTPEHSGNVSAIIETPWLNVGYSIVGVSKRYCLSQNIPEIKLTDIWSIRQAFHASFHSNTINSSYRQKWQI